MVIFTGQQSGDGWMQAAIRVRCDPQVCTASGRS